MSNSSIWPMDRFLSDATTPGQSEPGGDGKKEELHISQSFSITEATPTDCLVSYLGHSLGESYLSAAPVNWASIFYNTIWQSRKVLETRMWYDHPVNNTCIGY